MYVLKHKKKASKPKGQSGQKPKKKVKNNQKEEMKIDETAVIRGINLISLEEYTSKGQTNPPTRKMNELYEDLYYPVNQTLPHPKEESRMTEKQAQEKNMIWESRLRDIREASEIHRQVRQAAQLNIRPGMTMIQICEMIESATHRLVGFDPSNPMARSWGFPTGCSLNHCAAHYTPNPNDTLRLKATDLCKIDFGVQINGHIIDSAFSMTFDDRHDTLMEAVKAATNRGVEVMGIGARLGEIGGEIQEVMESYECTYDGKVYPVKAIQNLNGHSIKPYVIHGGKTVPIIKSNNQTKMEEGELFAIETFGSTGKGFVQNDGECSHFAVYENAPRVNLDHKGARDLLRFIHKRYGTLPFCRRWLQQEGQTRHLMSLKKLVDHMIVHDYPPLSDIVGSYTAQYEHTILLRPTCKEVMSRGTDF